MTRLRLMDNPTDHPRPRRRIRAPTLAALVLLIGHAPAPAQPPAGRLTVAAVDFPALRDWDGVVDREIRAGGLRRYDTRPNPYLDDLRSERFAQHHEGVPVYGADLVRQTENGVTTALLGTLFTGIDIDTTPALSAADARAVFDEMAGPPFGLVGAPSLWVFPLGEGGGYTLAWRGTLASLRDVFIDADTGGTLFETSRIRNQAVGLGTGQLDDLRKMATESMGGTFRARDTLRPAEIETLDLAYDEDRFLATILALFNGAPPPLLDLAADADNVWEDGTVVDVHTGMGWTYDYLATQLGRAGIDGRDGTVTAFVHPVTPERVLSRMQACFETADDPLDCITYVLLLAFIDNAAYIAPFPGDTASTGLLVFGEPMSLPRPLTALDIVAHEIAHGVTHFTAGLANTPPPNEPGAINEAFSDIIGTATEFYIEEPGEGPLRADYLMGEDAGPYKDVGPYLRSLRDPQELSDPITDGPYPDHYDMLYRGEWDAGGVHINATILGHAYFLAVEGGTNRTSGITVTGVGHGRRLEIERIFFNAWVGLLPAFADHAVAAQALVQSANDLFGADAASTRALADALRAVGILP